MVKRHKKEKEGTSQHPPGQSDSSRQTTTTTTATIASTTNAEGCGNSASAKPICDSPSAATTNNETVALAKKGAVAKDYNSGCNDKDQGNVKKEIEDEDGLSTRGLTKEGCVNHPNDSANSREMKNSQQQKAAALPDNLGSTGSIKEDTKNKKPRKEGTEGNSNATQQSDNEREENNKQLNSVTNCKEESKQLTHGSHHRSSPTQESGDAHQSPSAATTSENAFGCSGRSWDLESALHYVVNSRSRNASVETEREYLWSRGSLDSCASGGINSRSSSRAFDEKSSSKKGNTSRPWITFRLGHAGDVSELARLYRCCGEEGQQQQQETKEVSSHQHASDETTSLEVRLAEGMGDEDHPPVVYCLLAYINEELTCTSRAEVKKQHSTDTKTDTAASKTVDNNARKSKTASAAPKPKPNEASEPLIDKDDVSTSNQETPNVKIGSRLGAATLLTEQLDYSFNCHSENNDTPRYGKIIRVEWMFVDQSFSIEMQHCIQSKLWLCISSIGLLMKSPVYVVIRSFLKRTARTKVGH
ncbi:hypothetical protein ACA910_002393 [Epithemia clementina (nom. ined.)]